MEVYAKLTFKIAETGSFRVFRNNFHYQTKLLIQSYFLNDLIFFKKFFLQVFHARDRPVAAQWLVYPSLADIFSSTISILDK